AHRGYHLGGGADEHNSGIEASSREFCVLRQKAVAWMNRLRTSLLCRCNHARNIEVTVTCGPGPNQNGLVSERDMHRVAISLGIDGDSSQTHRPGRANDAAGDFAP